MGFKDDVRAEADRINTELASLVSRVSSLEILAAEMRRGQRSTSAPTTAARSTLDYGAIAFGLAEIKRKVAALIQGGSADMAQEARSRAQAEYAGAVDYFADVFAKADPTFDRAEFCRLAQR